MTRPVGTATRASNAVVTWLTRRGVNLLGARELETVGRVSGKTRTTPVNLLQLDGQSHLVAPRGHTDWVRNVRKNPQITLRLGKKRTSYIAEEMDGASAVPVLRTYLRKWAWEVKAFFPEGVTASSTDAELAAVVPDHPVFRITPQ